MKEDKDDLVINIANGDSLFERGVRPGWFIKTWGCSIWFEVQNVWDNMAVAASRDPHDKTDIYMSGRLMSSIVQASKIPPNCTWIRLNREKGFFDKFHPTDGPVIKFTSAESE